MTPLTRVPPRRARHGFITSDETRWREYVRQRLRSTTAALVLVLAVAIVALGIAVGLLLSDARQRDAETARAAALEQQITHLQARLDKLERR
jgi:Tfp pilus assembly protein PilN